MKYLVFTLFLILAITSRSQYLPVVDGEFEYTEVVQADSMSAREIYLSALDHLGSSIQSQADKKDMLIQDSTLRKIKTVRYGGKNPFVYSYNLQIDTKDGRYRIVCNDFQYDSYSVAQSHIKKGEVKYFKRRAEKIALEVMAAIEGVKAGIAKKEEW